MSSSNISEAGRAMQAWAKANVGTTIPRPVSDVFKEMMKAGEYSKAKEFIEHIMSQYPMHPMPPPPPGALAQAAEQTRGRRKPTLTERLCMRMGWDNGIAPFHLHLHEDNGVHVLVIKDGEAVLFKDDSSMFPCDETVTKLRMLCS